MKILTHMIGVAAAVALVAGGTAAFDIPGDRTAGLGGGMLLSDASASSLVMAPTLGIEPGEWKAELAGIRRFELSELDEVSAAAAYARGRMRLALRMAQFGSSDLFAERTYRLAGGYCIGRIGVSGSVSARTMSFGGGYEGLSAATVGVGMSYRADRLILAMTADNLTRPRMWEGAEAYGRTVSLYAEWAGQGTYQLMGGMRLEEGEAPRFGVGQRFVLDKRAAIFLGVATDPLTWGGGIDIMHGGARLTYAASYHPVLGLTHTLSVGFKSRTGK